MGIGGEKEGAEGAKAEEDKEGSPEEDHDVSQKGRDRNGLPLHRLRTSGWSGMGTRRPRDAAVVRW